MVRDAARFPSAPAPNAAARDWADYAFELFWLARYDDAVAAAERAIERDPSYARAYATKGVSLVQLGRPLPAKAAAEEAVRLDPGYGLAHSVLGFVQSRLGDDAAAVACFDRAVATSPGDSRVYYNYACYWAEQGDGERCRQWLERGLELDAGMARHLPVDPDFARFAGELWFRELVARFKERAGAAAPRPTTDK